jgi:hypothetical protein
MEISQIFLSSFNVHLDEELLTIAVHEDPSFCAVKLSNLCSGAQMLTRFEETRKCRAQKLKISSSR